MKSLKLSLALIAGLAFAGAAFTALADDATTVTITGNMVCGKCTLHETKSCQNVIQVEKDGKTVNYYLTKNETSDALHEDVCHGDTESHRHRHGHGKRRQRDPDGHEAGKSEVNFR